jgi:chromosome segregation ATPase
VQRAHDALEAGRRATTEFGKAAAEASARSSRLSTAMAEGAQRIQSLGPRMRALGEDGDALRREGEEIAEEARKAHDDALAVAKFLETAAPMVADLGRQATMLRDAASRR